MRITDVATTDTADGARLTARIVWDRARHPSEVIEYTYRGLTSEAITSPGDALLASMLIPAMAVGEDIALDAPVSCRLLRNVERIVMINHEWYPRWHPTRVEAPAVDRSTLQPQEVAAFLSGGVDSFHTIFHPPGDPVTLLFTLIGFDLRFEKRRWVSTVLPQLEKVAQQLRKRLIVVDSNAYEIGHKYVFEAEHHGGFLASAPLALGGMVRRGYVSSGWALWRLQPFSSHPAVDPLWSTERFEYVNTGSAYSRHEKTLAIAHEPVVLENLRVCLMRPDLYNCRRCIKCVTTALSLHLAGTLDRCSTLGPIDPETVRRAPMRDGYLKVVQEMLPSFSDDPDLVAALRHVLFVDRFRRLLRPLLRIARRRRLRARIRAYELSQKPGDTR